MRGHCGRGLSFIHPKGSCVFIQFSNQAFFKIGIRQNTYLKDATMLV